MTTIPNTRIVNSRRVRLALCGAGVAAAALAVPSAGIAAGTSSSPEVQALLARMAAVKISSERFTSEITVRPTHLPRGYEGLRKLTVRLAGEATLGTPPSAVVTSTALGKSVTARLVGDAAYFDEPSIAKHDGGRPWVKETIKGSASPFGSTPGIGQAGAGAPFAGLAKLVGTGRDVKDLGPETLDGQSVTRISFTIDPAKLATGALAIGLRGKLGHHATSRLEVDLNSEGLPVRTAGLIAIGKVRVGITAEILAVDFPLSVAAPPPAETITAPELLALLKKSSKKKP